MKKKAIWIIDHKYVVPAYLSIASFLSANDVSILVVFCGEKKREESKSLFTEMNPNVIFETFPTPTEYQDHLHKGIITNRLARMEYASKFPNELVLLCDADTLFQENSHTLLETIEREIKPKESLVFGVLDAKIAYRDYLYFRTTDRNGRSVVVPHLTQKDIYSEVFGPNWWHLLKGASLNNGIIAFYNCDEVISEWKNYYTRGLKYSCINPGDDQLPLAAAIHLVNQKVVCLPERFNSKGIIDGPYVVYHALSSIWKMQIYSAAIKEEFVSDFADLAKKHLPSLPEPLLTQFINNDLQKAPYLYRKLEGKFGFQHLYQDMISGIDNGTIVEVGVVHGKSTCYMAELIRQTSKRIEFVSIAHTALHEKSEVYEVIRNHHLEKYVGLLVEPNIQNIDSSLDHLDFVFLNLENDYTKVSKHLDFWYSKLKPGGVIAGYDFTSQIGLHFGNKCASYDFCVQHNLSVRISFDIFIIEKPAPLNSEPEPLFYHDSNVYL